MEKTAETLRTASCNGNKADNEYLDRTDAIKCPRPGTIVGENAYEPLQVDKVANHSYSSYSFGQVTEGPHSHTTALYEPLQVDQVGHHSYSKCTFGQVTEGGQDGEYDPLDITALQATQFTVPVAGQTPGETNEHASSLFDLVYAVPDDATSKIAEMDENTSKLRSSTQGTVTNGNSAEYANTGFTSDADAHKNVTNFNVSWRQHFPKMTLKGRMKQPPPMPPQPSQRSQKDSQAVNLL